MKSFAGMFFSVILFGCGQPSVEQIETHDAGWRRIMMQGDSQHGWCVHGSHDGTQQWSLFEDNIHVASITLTRTGHISEAWYEADDYFMVIRHFEPGEPLGHNVIELQHAVELEAQRRQITLPNGTLGISPHSFAGAASADSALTAN